MKRHRTDTRAKQGMVQMAGTLTAQRKRPGTHTETNYNNSKAHVWRQQKIRRVSEVSTTERTSKSSSKKQLHAQKASVSKAQGSWWHSERWECARLTVRCWCRDTQRDKHESRHERNCTSKVQSQSRQSALAMTFTNRGRAHKHRA